MPATSTTVQQAIDTIHECIVACERCADHCIEQHGLQECVRRMRDVIGTGSCAVGFLSRGSSMSQEMARVCAIACERAAELLEEHEECRETSSVCRHCAEACTALSLSAYLV